MSKKRVSIIGSGIAGMSAASVLAKEGFEVTVFEKNDHPGGRMMWFSEAGFKFDMGPSWYLTPDLFENFFAQFGKTTNDLYQLEELDPLYSLLFEDDTFILPKDPDKLNEFFDKHEENGAKNFAEFLKSTKTKYKYTKKSLLFKPSISYFEYLNLDTIKALFNINLIETYHQNVSRYFKNERVQKIFEILTVLLGGSPFNMPAAYTILCYMIFGQGVWYPKGGFSQVANGFYKLAKSQGAIFKFNSEVKEIKIENNKAVSINVNGENIISDFIISNAEHPHAYKDLISDKSIVNEQANWDKLTLSPTTMLIFLGIDKRLEGFAHHSVAIRNWDNHIKAVFSKKPWLPENPSYYISCPSRTDNSILPNDSSEAMMILVPISPDFLIDETKEEKIYKNIVKDLSTKVGFDIEKHIIVKKIVSHSHFKSIFNSFKGGSFGLAHTFKQTAVLRPKLKSKKIDNLYFCGHYTVPGVGLPTSMISGELVAKEIIKN